MNCRDCEYEPHCNILLRIQNRLVEGICKQGRRKREYKTKTVPEIIPKTLKEIIDEKSGTDTEVEKVLSVQ